MGATAGGLQGTSRERRKHFRVPIHLPTHVTELQTQQSYAATLLDLSLRGLGIQSLSARFPQPGTRVLLGVALNGDVVNVTGTIRWTAMEEETPEGSSRCGVCLDEELKARIPIHYALKICEAFDGEVHRARTLRERYPLMAHGIQETYPWSLWGQMLGTVSELAQALWASCAARVDLNAFRTERLQSDAVVQPDMLKVITEDLKKTGSQLRALATMFRCVRDKHLALSQNYAYLVDMGQVIASSVQSMRETLAGLTDAPLPEITYKRSPLPLMFGRYRDFATCFDGLLVFSFRSAFFNKGSRILVQSQADEDRFVVSIEENGSRALDRDLLEISPQGILDLETFTQRDMKAALWLYCGLLALEEHEPTLQVRSESGRNVIRLVLPLEPSFRKTSGETSGP
ncbi:MAG: PilZ domain-containing protein [Desulfacinum sp.]|nr:PilZ domain-containing protein [Desulfacinum sp.]